MVAVEADAVALVKGWEGRVKVVEVAKGEVADGVWEEDGGTAEAMATAVGKAKAAAVVG